MRGIGAAAVILPGFVVLLGGAATLRAQRDARPDQDDAGSPAKGHARSGHHRGTMILACRAPLDERKGFVMQNAVSYVAT